MFTVVNGVVCFTSGNGSGKVAQMADWEFMERVADQLDNIADDVRAGEVSHGAHKRKFEHGGTDYWLHVRLPGRLSTLPPNK